MRIFKKKAYQPSEKMKPIFDQLDSIQGRNIFRFKAIKKARRWAEIIDSAIGGTESINVKIYNADPFTFNVSNPDSKRELLIEMTGDYMRGTLYCDGAMIDNCPKMWIFRLNYLLLSMKCSGLPPLMSSGQLEESLKQNL